MMAKKTREVPKPRNYGAKPVRKTGQAEIEKNIRKLERGRKKPATPAGNPGHKETDDLSDKKKLKIIWQSEGVDAALACAKSLGFTQIEVMQRITKWMRD